MDIGDLFAGLNALDVIRVKRDRFACPACRHPTEDQGATRG